jgi:hypothetical protein
MGVDLPRRFGNSNAALVFEFEVDLLVIGVLVGDNGLFVVAGSDVAVGEAPDSLSVGLVVAESALVVGAVVGEDPSSPDHLVLLPLSHQLVPALSVRVRPLPVLLPEHPPPRVDVLVRVAVGALPVLYAVLPLTCVSGGLP